MIQNVQTNFPENFVFFFLVLALLLQMSDI